MAIQLSPHCVLSLRTCSSLRNTTSINLLYFRRSSSVKVLSLLNLACYSTYSSDESCSSSKRRSRGPVMAAKKASEGAKQEEGRYKHTVDLPKTTFGMRANSSVREPEIQKLWDENQVFKRVADRNNRGTFVLHDGPPYANGDLHMGHALNKILKDIINRYKLLQNYKVHYVPGWDCHGLPIELKVLQSLDEDARRELTPLKLRAKAAKFAKATVKTQMASFKRYGVWADWDHPYLTLDPEYEAAQIEVFAEMALQGYIYRGRKPVHWSPSSRTALAEAELEYPEGHVSKSIYATFRLVNPPPTSGGLLAEFFPNLSLAIWTTTPWTIPANAAVAVNPKLQYAIVEVHPLFGDDSASPGDGKKRLGNVLKGKEKPFLIVASDLVSTLEAKWDTKLVVKKTLMGSDLENYRYIHPIDGRECRVVVGGDYISTESGTGLVHTAPGHGQEDYVTGLKYGLPLFSPVDDDGKFTEEAGQFSGLDVLGDGNVAVIKYLDEHASIIMVEPYKHKYPYDWRTKKPTIFRATEQWFASVEGFRKAAMDAISQVTWIPSQTENRISAMTSSRSDWCISRQRTWGVPIPVFYHEETKEPLLNEETINHIKSIISQKGSDAWWYMKVEELLPDAYRDKASEYEKGTDTMDVWFDSGSSWASVLEKRGGLSFPADLYLEGTDQHRGWFQSSLLTSIATKGKAPYSGVITHGFVLDERGLKMSKSLGNVVDPSTVIEGRKNPESPSYGADVLRLWVSSVDYSGDVMIGSQGLRQMSDIYRKLRGTLRFLLANLHDWEADYAVPCNDLPMIDQHALFQLENVVKNIKESYENYQFFKIFQVKSRLQIYKQNVEAILSTYMDILKKIDGNRPKEVIFKDIDSLLSQVQKEKEKTTQLGKSALQKPSSQEIWRGIPTRLNNIPHSREIREYFYDDVLQATQRAVNDGKTRLKVEINIPELNPEMDVYRIGTLMELVRVLALNFADDGKRIKVCVQGSMGEGALAGMPLQLAGTRTILEYMDWGDYGAMGNFISIGSIGGKEVTEQDDLFILVAPQNAVGNCIIDDLRAMTDAAGNRPVILINPRLKDLPASSGIMQTMGRDKRLEYAASFEHCYHFRLLYYAGTQYPIMGALRMSYPYGYELYKRVDDPSRKEKYIILSTFPKRPDSDEINDAFEGKPRNQAKKASGIWGFLSGVF